MTVGILISCRMDAPEYPGRPLTPILDRAAIAHPIDRLSRLPPGSAGAMAVILVTTDRTVDDPIESFAKSESVQIFRGGESGAGGRLLAAARRFGLDWLVSLGDDTVIVDPDVVRDAVEITVAGGLDLVSDRPARTFPQGMRVEVLRTDFLAEHVSACGSSDDPNEVTTFFYRSPSLGRRRILRNEQFPALASLHLSLDGPADARLLAFCLRHLAAAPSEPVLATLAGLLEHYRPAQPWVGSHGPLLIAEIGGNHEGDFSHARTLTELAIAVRPDFVKFQIYTSDSLVSRIASAGRHAHFRRFELTRDQHVEIAHMCRSAGVGYMASVWDVGAFEWVDRFVEIYKIGSGDLDATSVLRRAAVLGKPIILSTGLATEEEVVDAVETLAAADARYRNPEWLALLQCTSMYPIERRDANLAVMRRLHELTGLSTGFSDHTENTAALHAAAAMGARVLEFHFTDRRTGRSFRDHRVSLLPDEVARLQRYCDEIVVLRGSSRKRPLPVEEVSGHVNSFRRALYPVKDLPPGHRLRTEDLIALRPRQGIAACELDRVVGRYAVNALPALTPLRWADLAEKGEGGGTSQ